MKARLLLLSIPCLLSSAYSLQDPGIIRDNAPAYQWDYGYGTGNGRIGALSYTDKNTGKTLILLNEKSIFTYSPSPAAPQRAAAYQEVIKLCNQGKYAQATELYSQKVMSPCTQSGKYQPAGHLELDFAAMGAQRGISRALDINKGLITEEVTRAAGAYRMQLLTAPNSECAAILLESAAENGISFNVRLTRPDTPPMKSDGADYYIAGQAGDKGTAFETKIRVIAEQGQTEFKDGSVFVSHAKRTLILVSAATDFDRKKTAIPLQSDWAKLNKERLNAAQDSGWQALLKESADHFGARMARCSVDLGDTPADVLKLTTKERLKRYKEGAADPDLQELLFQFGRYCILTGSAPGTLPATLQGIWNPHMNPPWNSCFFLNINCQMNYWPVEVTNLSEYHQPFTDFVISLLPAGRQFAKELGYDGFCFCHNTDCRAGSNFRNVNPNWAGSLLNGTWAAAHLMEHYRFNENKAELKKDLPMLRECVRFILGWLQTEPGTGRLVTGPGTSPELGFIYTEADGKKRKATLSAATSHDLQLAGEAMSNYLEACQALNVNDELTEKVSRALPQLALTAIRSDGRLAEWRNESFTEDEKGHRHFSHLYALYPGNQIDIFNTPEYAAAAEKSLNYRCKHGSGHTGWSAAWLISLYARLHDGKTAGTFIDKILKEKTNDNLFTTHPPFQIDGNYGFTAGIAECLIQSHVTKNGKRLISLAPALLPEWKSGSATGLRARGGLTVNLKWSPNGLTAHIKANRDGDFIIEYKRRFISLPLKSGQETQLNFP